jgi:quinol monooxygenase YgiN
MTTPVLILHLRIRARGGQRDRLLQFLAVSKSFYESPGGITMRVLQHHSDDHAFIEVFEYESVEVFEKDERRVAADPAMKQVLETWRSFLDGPPVVEVFRDVSEWISKPSLS